MKDWLTVIIVLLIVGVLLDGLRRMRLAKREGIKLSKNARKADLENEIRVSTSEFPSGGARVAATRETGNRARTKESEGGQDCVKEARNIPEQVALNLEESVPMLMDSVEDDFEQEEVHPEENEQEQLEQEEYGQSGEPEIGSMEHLLEEIQSAEEPAVRQILETDTDIVGKSLNDRSVMSQGKSKHATGQTRTKTAGFEEPEEVLVVNVMCKPDQRFKGDALLFAMMEEGLKLGEMDIFHRHKDNDGDAPIVFSLANMVVPGTFNLAEMSAFETPGVSLFLSLPISGDSISAYNDMIETAKRITLKLDGELKDENRSVMTAQTIEHGRQRVIEFERKQKLHA